MARLFISYRRQDDGVQYLKERLKQAHYAIWFDTDNILLGDPDWQESIVRGMESSDAVVLCFSPRVLESQTIRFEIRTAHSKNKPIFIVVIQPFENIFPSEAELRSMGLNERYQAMDFTQKDRIEANLERLIRDLYAQGIRPTLHQLRQRKQEDLHEQRYLRQLIDDAGTIRLHEVNPDYDGSQMPIENLYVPLQTDLRLVLAIEKYDVERWWLCRRDLFEAERIEHRRLNASERAALDAAHDAVMTSGDWDLGLIEILVEERRESLFQEEKEARRSRMARLDRAYQVIALDAGQVAVMSRQLLLIGEAGTGKTTFSNYLSACLAGHLLPNFQRPLNHAALGRWTHGELTPVYIKMRWLLDDIERFGWSTAAVEAYIQGRLLKDNAAFFPELQRDLEAGYEIIVLDGLERLLQVPRFKLDERHRELDQLLASLRTHYDQCRLLMTGRPEYFTHWQPSQASVAHLAGLSPVSQTRLAAQIYANRHSLKPETATNTAYELTGFLNQFSPQFSSNPRFAALLSTVYPAKRGILYRRTIDLLLDNWTQPSPGLPSIMEIFQSADMSVAEAEEKLIETLGEVVFETAQQFPDRAAIGETLRSSVLHHLGDLGAYYDLNPERVRAYLSENAGVLVGSGDNFRFAHDDFRQYFLAEHLLKQIARNEPQAATSDSVPLARRLMWEQPRIWADPIEMIGDLLVDESHGALNRVWDLIEDLIGDAAPDDPEAPSLTSHAEAVRIAARIALNHSLNSGRLRASERSIFGNLIDWLIALIESPDALMRDSSGSQPSSLVKRAEIGRMLGVSGDTRAGIGLPIEWAAIPAGKAFVGGSHLSDPYGPEDTSARQEIQVPAFQIGRYPVTYAQYEAFVEAGGYQEQRFWVDGNDDSGWVWCQGRTHPDVGWHDPAWHVPNHPVIGVTWYEAAAFCRWLSAELGAEIRLPTVAEWIRAARGADEHIFPYGGTFDATRGNTYLSGAGRTTAAGMFPRGSTPQGVADLSGNVYEWCQDVILDTRLDGQTLRHHPLKGGSWSSYPGFCRIDALYQESPAFATTYWGFRALRSGP